MSERTGQLTMDFAETGIPSNEPSYLLRQLEVFNWGPFKGLHRAEFDAGGTAIIGPTGSGKTTLVDALMTLLVQNPRYNLASTGGNESDRDLISYIRGVLSGDGANGQGEIARPGKTMTGICATYQSGSETLRLGGLLWIDGSSGSAQDLKRRWIFSQADGQSLETWLTLLHEDGVRDLIRMGRETARLRIFESKKGYLAHVRKFFDVGENAFTLLNRAAGLKQLNSIDEIFRELVLDDRSAFDRALEVAGEFDILAGIHAELETARRQRDSLIPVAEAHRKLEKSRIKAQRLETLKRIVPLWFATAGERLWTQVLHRYAVEKEEIESRLHAAREAESECKTRVDTLHERYLNLGGNVIGELETTMDTQRALVAERKKHADDYRRAAAAFGLGDELNEPALLRNQATLSTQREEIQQQRDVQHEEALNALSQQRDAEFKAHGVAASLQKVKDRPGSNIPPQFQDFRAELAAHIALPESDLPFLAELIEVKSDETPWRGAIERAIGSERLRVLVPEAEEGKALRWVNDRDNRLHVRLQRAGKVDQPVDGFADGFVRKLNFKSHPLEATARRLLASRDLHCVDSPQALRHIEHGLTREGLMSGRRGKYEKQDQRRLEDNWMTGFDNKDQLQALARELTSLTKSVEQHQAESKKLSGELKKLDGQLTLIDRLVNLEFATIDLPSAESDLARSQQRLKSLLAPDSDAIQAKGEYDAQRVKLNEIREGISKLGEELAVLDDRCTRAEQNCAQAAKRIGDGLTDDDVALAEKRFPIDSDINAEQLDAAERKAARDVDERLEKQHGLVAEQEKRLVRLMESALRADTGALVDTGSELEDIDKYLARLRVLNEEALPEKQSRFLDYLNRSSDQGVTQLLSGIAEEVDAIEHRIAELNQTLVKVDFRSGRYLQLQPQRIKHERLRSLETAMRKLRSAALKDDEGESHYKALQEVVVILSDAGENRRQLGSRALLDPCYRLQFYVVEVDRTSGDRSPPRTGSQSGSGGEKELMASHILTASLSYALCPAEATTPLYGTVVLDEAFSKSSPSAAGRIIEALRIFRLHPIFVTPNKEIGLLKQHTRKVICVQRPQKDATLASISWKSLEELTPSNVNSAVR